MKNELFLLNNSERNTIGWVEKLFQYLMLGHSGYQIEKFIVDPPARSSPDRGHRQCLLEIYTRYHGLLDLHYQHRKTELEIERFEVDKEESQYKIDNVEHDEFDKKRLEVQIKRTELEIGVRRYRLANIRKAIEENMREIRHFKENMERLEPLCKYPLPQRYELCEPEYWMNEYRTRLAQGKIDQLPSISEEEKRIILKELEVKMLQSQEKIEIASPA